jgi:DNA-binding CsgD family transcriptional regulator/PAS domain-containing protein
LHGGREAAALEEALALAGDIYDAALDPARWPETLKKLAQFVGSAAAALVSEDAVARKGGFHFSWGDDPYYTRLYYEKYIYLNPHLAPLMLLRVGEVRSASSLISCDQFRATRFYREWAGPAGYCDNTFAVVEKSAAVGTFLAAPHHDRDSPVNGEPRRRMELIVPHVRRAVAIGRLIEMQRIDADALADAVDALSAGVLLVGDGGRVVRTNAAARAMLAAGDMLYLDDGVLAARGAREVHRVLIDAIAGAMRDDVVVGPHGVAIPLAAGNGDRYVAHLLPLTSGARRTAGRVSRAGAAVFVHKAELGGLLPLEAMARQFGLSPAELRVLAAVVEAGGSVPDIAEVLGVSEPTVKTHLRRLFDKTGTGRQADLVRLVAGYANPMIGQSGSALDPVTGARSESSSRTTQRPSRPAI